MNKIVSMSRPVDSAIVSTRAAAPPNYGQLVLAQVHSADYVDQDFLAVMKAIEAASKDNTSVKLGIIKACTDLATSHIQELFRKLPEAPSFKDFASSMSRYPLFGGNLVVTLEGTRETVSIANGVVTQQMPVSAYMATLAHIDAQNARVERGFQASLTADEQKFKQGLEDAKASTGHALERFMVQLQKQNSEELNNIVRMFQAFLKKRRDELRDRMDRFDKALAAQIRADMEKSNAERIKLEVQREKDVRQIESNLTTSLRQIDADLERDLKQIMTDGEIARVRAQSMPFPKQRCVVM